MTRLTLSLFVALSLLVPLSAGAEDGTDLEAAKETYEEALEAFRANEHDRAANLFRESYELSGKPELLYNEAVARAYADDLPGARRVAAEALDTDLPDDVRARIRARISGWDVSERSGWVAAAVSQRLLAEKAAEGPTRPTPPEPVPAESGGGLRITSYVIGGLGLAALGTFVVAEVSLMSATDDMEAASGRRDSTAYREALAEARGTQDVGQIALVSAGVFLIAGAVLWVLSMPDEAERQPGVVLRF